MTTPAVLTNGRQRWVPHNRWDLARPAALPSDESIAVIVPYFEQPESLRRMYAALGVATLDHERVELVVIDDGSRAPPPPPPPDFPIPTRLLRQPDQGCRPGAARNLGVATAAADVLVFLDADTLPEPGTVARLAAWPAAIPDAVAVGRRGHVDLTGWAPARTTDWLRGTGPAPLPRADPEWLRRGYAETGDLLNADDRSYRFVISAVMACHRWLYDDIGGFDASRDEYGGDDWEFASRAFNNGAVLVHDPAAVAWHDEPDWGDRDGRPDAKNRQTLWLARAIPEPSTRGRGLLQRHPDVIARISPPAGVGAGQLVATVDSLLAALPDMGVHVLSDVPAEVARHLEHDPRVHDEGPTPAALARARSVIDLHGLVRWEPDGLRDLVESMRPGGPGIITVIGGGRLWATVSSMRALGRVRRAAAHGVDDHAAMSRLFGEEMRAAADVGLRPLGDDVDLAGVLAGWS